MSLLGQVAAVLKEAGIPFAAVGGIALAVRGVARSTFDVDLLTMDTRCLDAGIWRPVEKAGASVEIRRGDADDPLTGVVRIRQKGERPVDIVVGRSVWQADAIARAEPLLVLDALVPIVRSSDLVLLKLFAGGPQDAWDIGQLLRADADGTLVANVENALPRLPRHAATLWQRIRSG